MSAPELTRAPGRGDALLGATRPPRNPISSARLEVIACRSVGLFGVIFGLQTIPAVIEQSDSARPGPYTVLAIVIFGTLLAVAIASIVKPGSRRAFAVFAVVFAVAIPLWPLVVADPTLPASTKPWLWYLCTVATGCAAIAFPVSWASVYTAVIPLGYGIVRATPAGGGVSPVLAGLDAFYAIILGDLVLIIIAVLRQAAASVDRAQATALARYETAVRLHATEVERVQVDAIVHDSVLTTLLAAAAADTADDERRVAAMAALAIARLGTATGSAPDVASAVTLDSLVERLNALMQQFPSSFTLSSSATGDVVIPAAACEALYSASVQAMVNSVQHAGTDAGIVRTIRVMGTGSGADVVIADTGSGFALADVPAERIGVRVSIIERVEHIGGTVVVDSAPGEGTTIALRWSRREAEE